MSLSKSKLKEVYSSMTTTMLKDLIHSFEAEMARGKAMSFGKKRVELIQEILTERGGRNAKKESGV